MSSPRPCIRAAAAYRASPLFNASSPFQAALLLVAILAPASVAAQGFTLGQVMSSPMPSGLVSARGVGAVAWVQDAEGVRNIWAATAPDYVGHQVTAYSDDDGQSLTDVEFTPDGSSIVYARGGSPNSRGELPNPRSFAQGVSTDIWIVPVNGGEPRKLASGRPGAVSPNGDVLVYSSKGDVWSVPLNGSADAKRLFTVRGSPGSLRFSPDGSLLAFVSRREMHALVGVYSFAADSIAWMDPGIYVDRSPVWSPDGVRIAFIRQLTDPNHLPFTPVRTAVPWSIRVADVRTGTGSEVWRAKPGMGSAFYGVNGDGLWWGAEDRLVFPWEGNGWLNLYSVPVRGGEPTPLAVGDFEVQWVSMTPDRREMIFDSNQGDIDRKHLWRVSVSGGTPKAVTTGSGIEWSPLVTFDGAVAFMASGGTTPAHAEITAASGERHALDAHWLPARFPTDQLVTPRQVVFSSADGLMIHGQLFLPKNMKRGEKHPALLFFHGGSRRQMLLGFHHSGYYHNAYSMNEYLASRGFIVLSVNYRSGIGYGMKFREALGYGAAGGAEFNDVLGAGAYLRSRDDVDPDRIGLWGGSYGGYLTAMGLSRASDMFAAGVDLHGVEDWNAVIKNFVPSYDKAQHPEFWKQAFDASPMASVNGWRSPVLFIQGDDDRNVPFTETITLAHALAERGVHFEELVFPDEVHGFLMHASWLEAYHAAADFFQRMLVEGEAAKLRKDS